MTVASVHQTMCAGIAVMVVEDHDDSRQFLVLALEAFGAHVVGMSSAAQALRYLETIRPDVLVSDLSMPDMDGFELLHKVRASASLKDLPAIAVTGHRDLQARAVQSGFELFMRKPIDVMDLCRAIAALGPRRE